MKAFKAGMLIGFCEGNNKVIMRLENYLSYE
jgi:hypothetical protein